MRKVPGICCSRWAASALYLLVFILMTGSQPAAAPLEVHIYFSKAVYSLDNVKDRISATITLKNTSGSAVMTGKGFSRLDHQLYLIFKAPDGKIITSTSTGTGGSPTPSVPPAKVEVEELAADWVINRLDIDVRQYYSLIQEGLYEVWLSMPFVQYDASQAYQEDTDGDGLMETYVPYDKVTWYGSLESNRAYITLTTTSSGISSIKIRATHHIHSKGSKPAMEPLADFEMRLYKRSELEAAGFLEINPKKCAEIVTSPVSYAMRKTDGAGECYFTAVNRDNYLVIGYPKDKDMITAFEQLYKSIDAADPDWDTGEVVKSITCITR